MAKITDDQRNKFQEYIRFYKKRVEDITLEIKKKKSEQLSPTANKSIIQIQIAQLTMNQITILCGMNEISVDLMEVRNTAYLDKARQLLYEVLISLGDVVTNYLDVPFSEYSEKLSKLDGMSDKDKLNLIRQIGFCIDLVKRSFGDNTKWKWSFVEIDGRFAILCKNLFDLRRYQKLDSPTETGFRERRSHISIIQKTILVASQEYREKYELSTKDIEDLKKGIDFQKALLRINNILGDTEKIENNKKQIEVWNSLLEKHLAEMDERKRKGK